MANRKTGRSIEPSVRVQGELSNLTSCLTLGLGTQIEKDVILWLGATTGSINLGARVYIGPYCYLGVATHSLNIGEDTMIGAHSYIITENHSTTYTNIPYSQQGYRGDNIHIGSNVWIGCHVIILPGVHIGANAIVGAGSVVTKNIPEGETWAGTPAKFLQKHTT